MALFKAIRNILLSAGQTSSIGAATFLSTADQTADGLNAIKLSNAAGTLKGYVGYRQNDLGGFEIAGQASSGSISTFMQFGNSRLKIVTSGTEAILAVFQDALGLVLNGVISTGYIAKTANFTATSLTSTIDCTNTITITLPTAVGNSGRFHTIKNSGTGVITIATTSSQTIDGAATQSLATQWSKITVQSTGANWIIISN
jgi:hypothetical protein